MRIAVFIKATHFHKDYGGLETQNKTLCEGLVERGHEIVVFSPQRELSETEAHENGITYKFIPSTYRLTALSKNNWLFRSVEEFEKLHASTPFDLVVSQSSAGLGVIRKKKSFSIPVVAIAHGTILGEFKTRLQNVASIKDFILLGLDLAFVLRNFFGRQREFILGANRVIAVSNSVKEAVISETYVDKARVAVINNGVDPRFFEGLTRLRNLKESVRLLYVGRVIRSKGLFSLVQVLASPEFSDVVLYVIGEGKDKDVLIKKSIDWGVGNRVVFRGVLSHKNAMREMFSADIFVLPSLRVEGFPMVLPEAMFASLPVVASNMGGVVDAVVDGETGFLVSPGDKKELKEKLIELVKDPVLRRKMGGNGKLRAAQQFSLGIMLDRYEKVFEGILQ